MGLTYSYGIIDFFKESWQGNFSEKSLLMLGKLTVFNVTKYDLFATAKKLGVQLDYKLLKASAIDGGGVDSYSLFRALGFSEVHAMDISSYENADIIFDLNDHELPNELKNSFDYILDGGTTEHVFDYPQVLRNIVNMLKVGGKIFHYIPTFGWTNHGYYSLSPSLLADFYQSNGFLVEELNIIFKKKSPTSNHSLKNNLASIPDYRVYNMRDPEDLEGYSGLLRCIAQKLRHQEIISTPKQDFWYGLTEIDLLREVWGVDSGIENRDAAIGIFGVNDLAKLFLEILRSHPAFDDNKIKAFFVDKTPNRGQLFESYPVVSISEILSWRLNAIFLATFDRRVYDTFQPLIAQNIKVISPEAYKVFSNM
ncbi:MAG: class I SAM-dependent methyltransferase [Selenomonadaceae bacterium]|nr:class I SAM-dependent methyltransferase [Selenomonadaceae bacterium]